MTPDGQTVVVIANRSVGYEGKREAIFELQGLHTIHKIASVAQPSHNPKLCNDALWGINLLQSSILPQSHLVSYLFHYNFYFHILFNRYL